MRSCSKLRWDLIGFGLIILLASVVCPDASAQAQSVEPTPVPPALMPVAGRIPTSITLSREVAPSGILKPGDDVNVKLRVSGQKQAGCYGVPLQPVDLVVFADISPSAYNPNRIRGQQILRSLWAQMDQPIYRISDGQPTVSRIAFVTVDSGDTAPDEPRVRLPFTNTLTEINVAIDGWQSPGADTGFQKGIELATKLLVEQGRPEAKRVLVLLLHDNYFFDDKGVVLAAGKKAAAQAQVYVIGNLLNIEKAVQLTQDVAKQVTDSSDHVLLNPSAEDLRRLFISASGGNAASWGRVINISEELTPSELVAIWASDVEAGGKLDRNRIIWGPQMLSALEPINPVQVGYRFRIVEHTSAAILNLSATADLIDCNGFLHVGTDQEPLKGQVKSEPVSASRTPIVTPQLTKASVTPTMTPPSMAAPLTQLDIPSSDGMKPPLPALDPKWIILPLLLLLLALLLWWLLSRRRKREPVIAANRPSPRAQLDLDQKLPRTELPTSEIPSGAAVTPGEKSDDSGLRARLLTTQELIGRIPTTQRGFGRSPVAVRAFSTPAEMRGRVAASKGEAGLNLEAMGKLFKWQFVENGQTVELEIPTELLRQVMDERVTPATPLAAVWTLEPTDNARLDLRLRDNINAKQRNVQARCTYKIPKPGQIAPDKAYWLNLRFFVNPDRWAIIAQPAIETEGS